MKPPRSLAAAALLLAAAAPLAAQERPPNVVFIFTDDHAAQAVGAYGSRINRTPNIDRIAREGMLFRNCFVTNSICCPSRAVILTGKHSHRNGVYTNRESFDGSQATFPKLLRAAGWQTALIGKWHLKSDPTGFDHWEVLIGQGPYYNPRMKTPEGIRRHEGYTTDVITDLTLRWLREERDADRPFLLMCQHKAPHRRWDPGPDELRLYEDRQIPEPETLFDDYSGRASPAREQEMTIARHLFPRDLKFEPPRNLTEEQLARWNAAYGPRNAAFREAGLEGRDLVRWKYQRYVKDYLRCIAAVDEGIGRILDHLEESGLARDTIVVYCSDQGFYLGEHGWYDKRWMYEESLRTPLIVRWPGVTPAGSVNADLVQNLDLAQTFLDVAGVQAPEEMQGRSLAPLLRGRGAVPWRRSVYYHYYEFPGSHSVRRHYGVRTERYKLIHYYRKEEWELFDLEEDPRELRSVYGDPAYAAVRERLLAELGRLQRHYGDTDPGAFGRPPTQEELRRGARSAGLRRVFRLRGPEGRVPARPEVAAGPLTVGAWTRPAAKDGVVAAQGGEEYGWALFLADGFPCFAVRNEGRLFVVRGPERLAAGEPVHVAGVLDAAGRIGVYAGGRLAAQAPAEILAKRPADGLTVGADGGSRVGDWPDARAFEGGLADLRLYVGELPPERLARWAAVAPAF